MAEPGVRLPITEAAVYHAAMSVLEAWIALATERQAPAAYLRGLSQQSIVYPLSGSYLSAEVVNRAQSAARVEEGSPPIHLPSVIHWPTAKTRRSKRGTFYLVIPFPHGSPRAQQNPMSRRVYAVAKQLQPSQYLTAGQSHGRAIHAPGLQPYQPRNILNVRPNYVHASAHEGVRRVAGTGGKGSYVSFRTMRPDSPGWWIPARAGLKIAEQVARDMAPRVQQILEAAVEQDIRALLQQRLGR